MFDQCFKSIAFAETELTLLCVTTDNNEHRPPLAFTK